MNREEQKGDFPHFPRILNAGTSSQPAFYTRPRNTAITCAFYTDRILEATFALLSAQTADINGCQTYW